MGVLVKTSLFICILWGIHIWIKQVIDTEENNQKMEETLENMNHSYVEFQGKINQARKYRHDIPKHLHMMEQAVSDIIDDEYSVDAMLNAIACVTEEKCQEYNIQININLAIKEREIFDKLNIEKVDLSGLLQNLLDNAIEECCRISEDFERKILWTMNTTEYGVKIRVENTCCNIKNIDFGIFDVRAEVYSENQSLLGLTGINKNMDSCTVYSKEMRDYLIEVMNWNVKNWTIIQDEQ